MPRTKKLTIAREQYKCDFCKSPIKIGEYYVRVKVLDQHGRFSLKNHDYCDHTADLNELASRGEW